MIQFKRGSTQKWSGVILASGQPGYDKTKNKIKIGNGETSWSELPYTSGLHAKEILDSENSARIRKDADSEDLTLITYGTETPDNNTVGQIYLQQCDELDYVVEYGTTLTGWTYQKWKSGIAKCWCNYSFTAAIQTLVGLFYQSTDIGGIAYPIEFNSTPTETATIQSSSGQVLLTNSSTNTSAVSGTYAIISLVGEKPAAEYHLSIQVEGSWKTIDDSKVNNEYKQVAVYLSS